MLKSTAQKIPLNSISIRDRRNFWQSAVMWNVIMGLAVTVLIGPVFSKYVVTMGITNKVIGIVGGLSRFLPVVVVLLLSNIVEQKSIRKRMFRLGYLIRFIVPFGFLIIPFFPNQGQGILGIYVYGVCMCAYMIAAVIANRSFHSLLKDIISAKRVGSFYGKITAVSSIFGICPMILAAFLVAKLNNIHTFQIIFGLAALAGLSIQFFTRNMPEVESATSSPGETSEKLKQFLLPLKEKAYRKYYIAVFIRALFCAGPMYFIIYMLLRHLQIPLTLLVIAVSVMALFTPLFSRFWGLLCERFGGRNTMVVVILGISIAALSLVLPIDKWVGALTLGWGINPDISMKIGQITVGMLAIMFMGTAGASGIFGFGLTVSSISLVNEYSVSGKTMLYQSTVGLVAAVAALISTSLCGIIIDAFSQKIILGLDSYRLVMFFGLVLGGIISAVFFLMVENKRGFNLNIWQMWALALDLAPFKELSRIRRWSRPVNAVSHWRAAREIGVSGGKLSLPALLDGLDAPSYSVRRKALLGLGNFKDDKIRKILKEFFLENRYGFRAEAAVSLLRIGDPEDIAFLASNLSSVNTIEREKILEVALTLNEEFIYPFLAKFLELGNIDEASEALLAIAKPGMVDKAVWALEKLKRENLSHMARARLAIAAGTCLDSRKKFYSVCWQEHTEKNSVIASAYRRAGKEAFEYYENSDYPGLGALLSLDIDKRLARKLSCSYTDARRIISLVKDMLQEKKDLYLAILALFLLHLCSRQ